MDKTEKKKRAVFLIVWLALIAALLAAVLILGLPSGKEESIREAMRDGVLHEKNRISLFGLEVNPGLISAFCVSGLLITAALLIRIFVIPRFKTVPGKFQALLEKATDFFSDMAQSHASRWTAFAGAYIFSAGI